VSSEKSLLHDILSGNRAAQRELYDRYAGYAMATCLRYIADRDAVKDVMQDAFVKVFTSLSQFDYRGEGSLKAWVTRIAANESLNYVRRNERLAFTDNVPDVPDDEEPDIGEVPMQVLLRMIGDLPAGYRAVFNLFVFEGMSHKDIARALGIKESSSASQYLRAKRQLAKEINEYKNKQR
jgi:RNA polymerase sigma-70 factor (ECF subfamily)